MECCPVPHEANDTCLVAQEGSQTVPREIGVCRREESFDGVRDERDNPHSGNRCSSRASNCITNNQFSVNSKMEDWKWETVVTVLLSKH